MFNDSANNLKVHVINKDTLNNTTQMFRQVLLIPHIPH